MAAPVPHIPKGVILGPEFGRRPNARAFLAAAQVIDLADRKEQERQRKLQQEWQTHAFSYYHTLGIVHFGHDYVANCVARTRLYPGFSGRPSDPPAALDGLLTGDPQFELPDGANEADARGCAEEVAYLDASYDGGLGALAGDAGLNLGLTGEGFLHGRTSKASATGESFQIRSVTQLKSTSEGWKMYGPGETTGGEILAKANNVVIRMWRKDRQWPELADAPMRALLDDCDNLLALKRVLLAATYSRMHGGILKVPSELLFPQTWGDPSQQGQDNPVLEAIERALSQSISDPASSAAVGPIQISGPGAALKDLELLDIGRAYGTELLKQIDEVEKTIALGMDLPAEIITGLSGSNHWNAFAIDDQTFKAHIEPLVMVIARALTTGYLWPKLQTRGIEDYARYCFWYDPASLISHPDQFKEVQYAHSQFAASDDALRRLCGLGEDDAPDDEEIQKRLYQIQQQHIRITAQEIAPPGELLPAQVLANDRENQPLEQGAQNEKIIEDVGIPKATNARPASGGAPDNTSSAGPKGRAPAKPARPGRAASAGLGVDRLGARLAQIDADLMARIHTLAEQALQRALEQAGSQLKRTMRAKDRQFAATLRDTPLDDLAAAVGRERAQSWGVEEDRLINVQATDLQANYRKQVKAAIAAALVAAGVHTGDRMADHEIADAQATADRHISAGAAFLAAALVSLAHEQLFGGQPPLAVQGEVAAASGRVPIGTIRDALAIAGGGTQQTDQTQAPGGVALGPLVLGLLGQEFQVFAQSWQWVYGYPDREFPPHAALEGVEFSAWDDDQLANNEGWPYVDYFRPGDHAGCLCSYIPMFAADRPEDQATPEEAA
jgi:hypothetical protein